MDALCNSPLVSSQKNQFGRLFVVVAADIETTAFHSTGLVGFSKFIVISFLCSLQFGVVEMIFASFSFNSCSSRNLSTGRLVFKGEHPNPSNLAKFWANVS